MPNLWEKTKGAKDNSDLVKVDLPQLKITSPTVVYLPGRDQADNNPTELSKGINFVSKLFSDLPTPPKVYIWSHSDMYSQKGIKNLTSLFHVAAYSHFPRVRFSAAKRLAKYLVMPLATNTEDKKIPLEEAKKNLRNLTLLGYCFGSVTAQEMYNASKKMMRKAGYSKEEATELLSEVVLISFATFTRPKRENDRYTTLAFINTDDLFISAKNLLVLPLTSVVTLTKSFSSASKKLNITPLSGTSLLISATAAEQPLDTILGKTQQEVIDDVKLKRWKMLGTNHSAHDYVTDANESNQFASMVKYALLNAVTRTGKLRPVDYLDEPVMSKDEPKTSEQYEDKISGGLLRAASRPKWKRFFGLK